jgi:hypothetical protein
MDEPPFDIDMPSALATLGPKMERRGISVSAPRVARRRALVLGVLVFVIFVFPSC